jgi:hypothetical protein
MKTINGILKVCNSDGIVTRSLLNWVLGWDRSDPSSARLPESVPHHFVRTCIILGRFVLQISSD